MLSRRLAVIVLMLLIAGAAVGAAFWFLRTPPEAVTSGPVDPMVVNLQTMVESYRKVIVLLADVDSLNGAQRQQVIIEGQALFRANHEQQELMGNELWDMEASGVKGRFRRIGAVLDYIEQDDKLFDGDQLAFREPLLSLQGALTQDGSLEARHVNRRVTHDLHALDGIEQQFNGEFEQLFSRSENHVAPRPPAPSGMTTWHTCRPCTSASRYSRIVVSPWRRLRRLRWWPLRPAQRPQCPPCRRR